MDSAICRFTANLAISLDTPDKSMEAEMTREETDTKKSQIHQEPWQGIPWLWWR